MLHTLESLPAPVREAPDVVPAGLALPNRTLEPGAVLYETDRDASSLLHESILPDGSVDLLVEADRDTFTFHYRLSDGSKVRAGEVDTHAISVEASWDRGIACFTGLMIGIYATGNGSDAATPADFDWFDYQPASH